MRWWELKDGGREKSSMTTLNRFNLCQRDNQHNVVPINLKSK
jgi:hypothetical protein